MTSDRTIGIPPDHVTHDDQVYAADTVPEIWSIPRDVFGPIWDNGVTGEGVIIAVNDTGIASHLQLPTPIASKDFTGDGLGDRNGHGTHCAGSALGRDGVGVAPGASLIQAKVLGDRGSGSTAGINAARVWAAEQGADILSESLGGGGSNQADVDSIRSAYDKGVQLDVAAAGNAGYNGRNTIGYPGRYMDTMCIGAYREDGSIANFSSGGREIDVATPGEQIVSCSHRGGFVAMSGTSMATPHFAGLMALVIHKRRMAGMPDMHGTDEWRSFFDQQGFFEDKGQPGDDVRFGKGVPLIAAIINWLAEPEWI